MPDPAPEPSYPRHLRDWLHIIGPGAILASLTIGAGELVFSTRGGALFGYRILGLFTLVLLVKWALVFASGRHMVLSGSHPFERWCGLPGPPGWIPLLWLLFAMACFPVWIAFHAGTVGTLLAHLSGTQPILSGSGHLPWAFLVLGAILVLSWRGGYATLERAQIAIVTLMLGCVSVTLFLLQPDWHALLAQLAQPWPLRYPDWINLHPAIAQRPVWVEAATYVGVLGGSSYDYLAYVGYLREKRWGRAGAPPASATELARIAAEPSSPERRWLRALAVDSTLSFLMVWVFTFVFVCSGQLLLGPQHKVPDGANLLALQADFVNPLTPLLRPVYFAGAFLTMLGTLYGTIEVAPTIWRELIPPLRAGGVRIPNRLQPTRTLALGWCAIASPLVLALMWAWQIAEGSSSPPALVALLTPANLFTGVLGCGLMCWLNLWSDRRYLPPSLRAPFWLALLNAVSGALLIALGLKAYFDLGGPTALGLLAGTFLAGWLLGLALQPRRLHAPD